MEKKNHYTVNMQELWKRFYTGRQLIFICVLFLLSCWGTIDSFYDPGGHRILGWFGFIAVAIVAIVQVTSILWEKKHDLPDILGRVLFGALCGAVPLIIANGIFLIGGWLLLAGETDLANPAVNHYWSEGTLGIQLLLLVLVQYLIQILSGAIAFIVVILPVLSIIKPDEIAKGSNLEVVENEKVRKNTTRFVYIGAAFLIIGGVIYLNALKATLPGTYYLPELWDQMMWILAEIRYGIYDPEQIIWLFGIVFLAIGLFLLIWGAMRINIAKHLNKKGK